MDKVRQIIKEEFDLRTDAMVVSYLIDKGITFCSQITEEDIAEVEGNAMMTQDFVQSMVRAASRIAKECDLFDDIIPYIIMEMSNNKGINWHRMNEIAGKSIDGLIEDGMNEAYEYLRDEIELDESEAEWFGITDLYDEEEW